MRIVILIFVALLATQTVFAGPTNGEHPCESACENERECRPYGGYCRNRRQGWYGGRREIKGIDEARQLLLEFYGATRKRVGEIRERDTYFEAEVVNPKGKLLDRVIVEKRNGRIRSTY